MSREKLRFEANIPKIKDKQLQRTLIDLSRDLKAISGQSNTIDGGRVGMVYETAEDATKWPIIDGVHQKNGYALCDGKTLSSRSNKYSKFHEATGGLKLPNGYMRSNTIDLPTTSVPAGWDAGRGAGAKGYAEVDSSGQWYLDVTITREITAANSTYIELDGVRHTGIDSDYQALAQNDSGSISGVIAGAYAHWQYPRIYNTFSSSNQVFWVSGKYRIKDMPDWFAENNESWPIIQITEDAYEMGTAQASRSSGGGNVTGSVIISDGGGGSLEVYDEGTLLGPVTKLNFIGSDVSAILNGDTADIYVPPVSLTGSGSVTSPSGTQRLGVTVTSVTLSWSWNPNVVDSQELIAGPTSPTVLNVDDRTLALSGLSITDDTTWRITGVNNTFGNKTINMNLNFANDIYYGKSNNTSLTEPDIKALSNSNLSDNAKTTYQTGTNGSPQYFYICYPDRISDINVWTDTAANQPVPFQTLASVSITNSEGYVENYVVQRSVNAFTGNLTIRAT